MNRNLAAALIAVMIGAIQVIGAGRKTGGWDSARYSAQKLEDGFVIPIGDGFLKVQVCTEDVVHIAFARDRGFFNRTSLAAAPRKCEHAQWGMINGSGDVTLTTARLKVRVDLATGAVSFFDPSGRTILAERRGEIGRAHV